MSERILLYGRPNCGMVSSVRSVLEGASASYQYIDISQDAEARRRVQEINDGFESVPTLEFSDGSTLTEPAARDLEKKLAALGLQVDTPSEDPRLVLLLESSVLRIAAIGMVLVGLLGRIYWLLILGAAILALSLVAGWWRKRRG
jgi:mycoredoxin